MHGGASMKGGKEEGEKKGENKEREEIERRGEKKKTREREKQSSTAAQCK